MPLRELCRRAEDEIESILTEQVLELVAAHPDFGALTFMTPTRFSAHGALWECRIVPAPTEDTLVIGVLRIEPRPTARLRTERYPLHPLSRYNDCQLRLDPALWPLHESLGEIIQVVFEASSLWLNSFVTEGLGYLTDALAEALNNHLRAILPEVVANQVNLYAITDDGGFYLTDQVLRQAMIRRFRVDTKRNLAPVEAIADFSSRVLDPKDLLYAAQALREDATVRGSLNAAPYDSDFILAEEAVYSTGTIVAQPLIREGKTRLVAGYPATLEAKYPDLGKLLAGERKAFLQIVSARGGKLKRTIRLLQAEPLFRVGAAYTSLSCNGDFAGAGSFTPSRSPSYRALITNRKATNHGAAPTEPAAGSSEAAHVGVGNIGAERDPTALLAPSSSNICSQVRPGETSFVVKLPREQALD